VSSLLIILLGVVSLTVAIEHPIAAADVPADVAKNCPRAGMKILVPNYRSGGGNHAVRPFVPLQHL
jgi:hypothetical protein